MTIWRDTIDHVTYGEPAQAAIVGRPDRQLEANIDYLKAVVDAAGLGTGVRLYNQPIKSDVLVGHPVFWNAETARFEKALAAVELSALQTYIPAASADCIGIVVEKSSNTIGTILVCGLVTLDMSNAIDGSIAAGRYYLSAATAGKLVRQLPPVSVYVLTHFGNGQVFVRPMQREFVEHHMHFSVALEPIPAGIATLQPDNTYTITRPDPTVAGWLPADHAIFNGNAPTGAVFGYNISAHTAVQQIWPPIPLSAVLLEMLRPSGDATVDQIHGRVSNDLVSFNVHGIWWHSACAEQVPFETTLPDSSSSSSGAGTICPITTNMSLILSFVKQTFQL